MILCTDAMEKLLSRFYVLSLECECESMESYSFLIHWLNFLSLATDGNDEVKIGTACKNKGCTTVSCTRPY